MGIFPIEKGKKPPIPQRSIQGYISGKNFPGPFSTSISKIKKESLHSNSFSLVAHRGIPSFPQGILRSSNAYASGLLPQSPAGLPACFQRKIKKESLHSNSFSIVAHRGIPSFPQGILRSSNAYASGLLPQSPAGLPACFQRKIKKESLHSNSFSIVAHRGIEPLFPE